MPRLHHLSPREGSCAASAAGAAGEQGVPRRWPHFALLLPIDAPLTCVHADVLPRVPSSSGLDTAMTRQPFQATRFPALQGEVSRLLLDWLRGSWRRARRGPYWRWLIGLYAGKQISRLSSYFRIGQRPRGAAGLVRARGAGGDQRLRSAFSRRARAGLVICDKLPDELSYAVGA